MKIRRVFYVGIMCAIFCFALTACSEDSAKKIAQEIDDQVSNLTDSDDSHVVYVKKGCPVIYPNISYGDAFGEFFSNPTWKYFEADSGEDVVEFTGYCTYREKEVKARLQFILDMDNNTFTQGALSFNDVPQSDIITSIMICKAFDEYGKNHKIENDSDVSEEDAMGSGTETKINDDTNTQAAENDNSQVETQVEDGDSTTSDENTETDAVEDEDTQEDSEYIIPDSDTRKLTKNDIKNLSKKELRYARNEIYARHGRIFNDESLNKYFSKKSWYVGTQMADEFDESELSKVEKANIKLILKYENK